MGCPYGAGSYVIFMKQNYYLLLFTIITITIITIINFITKLL